MCGIVGIIARGESGRRYLDNIDGATRMQLLIRDHGNIQERSRFFTDGTMIALR